MILHVNRKMGDCVKQENEEENKKLLFHAIAWGQMQVVEELLAKNPTLIRAIDNDHFSVMHYAAGADPQDSLAVPALLVGNGADINAITRWGRTPLHIAAERGNVRLVEFLIEHGAMIDPMSHTRNTPLHEAIEGNHKKVVELLLVHGADPAPSNSYGRTPSQVVERRGHDEIAELLGSHTKVGEESATANPPRQSFKSLEQLTNDVMELVGRYRSDNTRLKEALGQYFKLHLLSARINPTGRFSADRR